MKWRSPCFKTFSNFSFYYHNNFSSFRFQTNIFVFIFLPVDLADPFEAVCQLYFATLVLSGKSTCCIQAQRLFWFYDRLRTPFGDHTTISDCFAFSPLPALLFGLLRFMVALSAGDYVKHPR